MTDTAISPEEQDFDRRRIALAHLKNERKNITAVGTKMANQGTILMTEMIEPFELGTNGEEWLVLAMVSKGNQGRSDHHHEFVVWRRCIGTGQRATGGYDLQDYCYLGGYHKDLIGAVDEYIARRDQHIAEEEAS